MARDTWHAAAVALHQSDPTLSSRPSDMVVVASQDGKPVHTFSGSEYEVDCSIQEIEQTQLIVVSGIWGRVADLIASNRPAVDWLSRQHEAGAIISCLHTGTFLLAESGLLDGRVATVYWRMVDEFKARYPKVILQPEKGITSADNIFCSSGISSALEMGSYLMEKTWGVEVAAKVARHFLMDIPDSPVEFQLALDKQRQHKDLHIRAAQQWMESNFSSDFTLEEAADNVGLSVRSFRRRFKDATGDSPMQYLQRIRIETAKQLLATSTLSVDQIAYRVGFEDASYFSRLFKRKIKTTPRDYRANSQ